MQMNFIPYMFVLIYRFNNPEYTTRGEMLRSLLLAISITGWVFKYVCNLLYYDGAWANL